MSGLASDPSSTPVSTSLRLYGAGKPAPGTESLPLKWTTFGSPLIGLYCSQVVPLASWTRPEISSPVFASVVWSRQRSAVTQYSMRRSGGRATR